MKRYKLFSNQRLIPAGGHKSLMGRSWHRKIASTKEDLHIQHLKEKNCRLWDLNWFSPICFLLEMTVNSKIRSLLFGAGPGCSFRGLLQRKVGLRLFSPLLPSLLPLGASYTTGSTAAAAAAAALGAVASFAHWAIGWGASGKSVKNACPHGTLQALKEFFLGHHLLHRSCTSPFLSRTSSLSCAVFRNCACVHMEARLMRVIWTSHSLQPSKGQKPPRRNRDNHALS